MTKMITQGAGGILQSSISVKGKVDRVTSVLVIADPTANTENVNFTQEDFHVALRKVSRRTSAKAS